MKLLVSLIIFTSWMSYAQASEQVRWKLVLPNGEGYGNEVVVNGIADPQSKEDRLLTQLHGRVQYEIHAWLEGRRLKMTLAPRFVKPRNEGSFVIGGGDMTTSPPQLLEDHGLGIASSWGKGAYLVTEEVRVIRISY